MNEADRHKDKSTAEMERYFRYLKTRLQRNLREPKFILELLVFAVLAIYTVFTGFMYCANKKAADAAKSAADTAAKQFETSERPWVDADIRLDGPLSFNVNGANLPLVFQLLNSGHSAALAVQIAVRP